MLLETKLSTLAIIIAAVATLVTADCILGNNVDPTLPLVTSGQFINIDRPAKCHGNITAWHFCYYPSSVLSTDVNTFVVWFRIWRPTTGNSYQLIFNFQKFGITVQRRDSIECETTEAQNVTIQPGDVIGIYMPDAISTVSALAFDPPAEQAGVFMDTRGDTVQLLSVGIQQRNLARRSNIGLHLYASTSVTEVPSQMPQSTEEPTANGQSVPKVQATQLITTAGNNDQIQDGSNSNNKGAVAAAVIVVLLIVVTAVVVSTVFLLCYLKRRNVTINCIKGKSGAMIAFDNLLYRAASERIPVKVPKRKTKNEGAKKDKGNKYPYDIPKDHHNRALYDIPRSSLSSSANYEVFGKPDSELTQSNTTSTEAENGGDVTATTKVAPVKPPRYEVPSGDDVEYIYMENTSETTDTNEQESDSSSEDYIHLTYASVQYKKLLKQATEDSTDLGNKESPYHAPPDREEEIYVVLSRQRIKVIPRGSIQITDHLGSGQFGNVEKGAWKGSRGTISVAIKTLGKTATEEDKIRLLQEAVNMGQFTHPNIVQLHGVVTKGEPFMLVMEYLPKGDLKKFLAHIRPLPGQLAMASTTKLLLGFSQQISLGMHYLATKGYIHRDIAARNIFLTEENTCKIGDFGMSRELTDDAEYYKGHGGKVPLKWTAPEAIHLKKYSTASDVWSYGCVLYEIWSLGLKPFKGLSNTEAVRKVTNGYRLPPPPGCPKVIYTLMIQCWHTVASSRPKYRSILTTLLEDESKILDIPVEEASTHPDAAVLGAPVEAGEKMYLDLQSTYLPDASDEHNPDYEFIRDTDDED